MNLAVRLRTAIAGAARAVAAPWKKSAPSSLSGVDGGAWGWLRFLEWRPGSFQSDDVAVRQDQVIAQATVFSCITLIASDIGKLRLKLVEKADGIWRETSSAAFSPVIGEPNGYQTRQKFIEQWIVSKLTHGNAYVLKERDARGVVVRLYVLDPQRVRPLVAPDGSVYYALQEDDLNRVPEFAEAVPASEIIHDRMVCLFHALVGVTPIFACGLASTQALAIQKNSAKFFENMSRPGGLIIGPEKIDEETARRLKRDWEKGFGGANAGRVAVLGDGLDYKPLAVNPIDAQLVDQLKLSAEQICSAFHVPGYKVGVGPMPTYQNAEVLNQIYFSDCLQALIKSLQASLSKGLGLDNVSGRTLGVHFDLDELLLMDSKTMSEVQGMLVQRGIAAPNEARAKFNLPPVKGGEKPYLQQQNFALEALARRDESDDPFGTAPAPAPAQDDTAKAALAALERVTEGSAKAAEAHATRIAEVIEKAGGARADSGEAIAQATAAANAAIAASVERFAEAATKAYEMQAAAIASFVEAAQAAASRPGPELDQTDKALHLLLRKAPEELQHA